MGFLLFYEIYYQDRSTTDALRFYDDSNTLFTTFKSDPKTFFNVLFGINMHSEAAIAAVEPLNNWYKEHLHGVFNDNMTIIRFNALIRIFSFDVYHIHTLAINFLAFIGLSAAVNAFKAYVSSTRLTFLAIFLFPGILFWSSGVLKEGLLLFPIGLLFFYGQRLTRQFNYGALLGFILFFLLGLLVKSYVTICLSVGMGLLFAFRYFKQNTRIVFLTYLGALIFFSVGLNYVFDLRIPDRIYQKQHDFLNEVMINKPGSAFEVFTLTPDWWSLISTAPAALVNALLRPFVWEANSAVGAVAALEILLLLALTVSVYLWRRTITTVQLQQIVALVFSAVLLLVIVGWVTPVFGALVRYKIPALLFILIALNIWVDSKKIPFIKKWL